VRNGVAGRHAACAGIEQVPVGRAGEDAVHGDAGRRQRSPFGKVVKRGDHGAAGGDDVIDQHRRVGAPALEIGHADIDVPIAAARLAQHGMGGIDAPRNRPHPLGAFLVGADEHGALDRPGDPFGDERGGLHGGRRDRVDVRQRTMAVKMRVDGHQPVAVRREHGGEMFRGDRFARPEAAVLAHVAEIGTDEPDRGGAEIARRRGGKQERQDLAVGAIEGANEDYVAGCRRCPPAQIGFLVGKGAHLELRDVGAQPPGEAGAEDLVAWQQGEERLAHAWSSRMISPLASRYSKA
jgi:hypothetical protein